MKKKIGTAGYPGNPNENGALRVPSLKGCARHSARGAPSATMKQATITICIHNLVLFSHNALRNQLI